MAPDGATGPAPALVTQLEPALVRPPREDQPHGSPVRRQLSRARTPARRVLPVCLAVQRRHPGSLAVQRRHSGSLSSFPVLGSLV